MKNEDKVRGGREREGIKAETEITTEYLSEFSFNFTRLLRHQSNFIEGGGERERERERERDRQIDKGRKQLERHDISLHPHIQGDIKDTIP